MWEIVIGKTTLQLADVNGAGAIVDSKGRVCAVFLRKGGWITCENDPEKWDAALDRVSVRVMKTGGPLDNGKAARAPAKRRGRKPRAAAPAAEPSP